MDNETKEFKKLKNAIYQQIWFVVNKNGNVRMFLDEPKKEEKIGKWVGEFPYVNSKLQNEINILSQKAGMNFEMEPQVIEIQFENF